MVVGCQDLGSEEIGDPTAGRQVLFWQTSGDSLHPALQARPLTHSLLHETDVALGEVGQFLVSQSVLRFFQPLSASDS